MFIKIDDTEYVVDFEYNREFVDSTPISQLTHSTVGLVNNHEVSGGRTVKVDYTILGHGTSVCHSNDNFKKSTGRKIALQRALVEAGFDKAFRARFFVEYFKQSRK